MSIIVLEGCDCVGKTTFAKMLSDKTGYGIVRGSSFEISQLGAEGMFERMMSILDCNNIIVDRFFYSNLVYGRLYNYPMMTREQYEQLTEKLNKKAVVLYLHASQKVIAERMQNRGDDMIKVSEIGDILEGYINEFYGIHRPKLMLSIDTSESNFNVATAMVKEIVDEDLTKTYIKNT